MMKNIAQILKNCPKGTKLYSPICGECELHMIDNDTITCSFSKNLYHICFDIYGHYKIAAYKNSECLLFPSKENRDWDKFMPFKNGDVLYINCNDNGDVNGRYQYIFILKEIIAGKIYCYCYIDKANVYNRFEICYLTDLQYHPRLATEEEKEKLFKAIKDNSYRWDGETKTLEKLVEPIFKVGDRIRAKKDAPINISNILITEVNEGSYNGFIGYTTNTAHICFRYQDLYELVPNKFDINTLVPFDKVLVRNSSLEHWHIQFFEKYDKQYGAKYPFVCMCDIKYSQCIPFEGNEHLASTANECNEYYKNW